ncbi:MAG: cellulase family glycosylhydrolase [Betaproteobacteria bacterium]
MVVIAAALALSGNSPAIADPPALGVSGTRLTLDGRPSFLLGVSLFDALGRTPVDDRTLDALHGWGIRVVRVWAHWSDPVYDRNGALTPDGRARLLALMDRLDARGMLLELVLLRPGQLPGQRFAVFASTAARVRAVEEIATTLKGRPNVLFDLYNEHDHPDGPISHADARHLRDRVKAIDPARLVTISSTEYHLIGPDIRLGARGERNLREEVGRGPGEVAVDLLAAHLPGTPDWEVAEGPGVAALRGALARMGRPIPIYLNEQRRSAPGRVVETDAYFTACAGARKAGAAGWVFHTSAGYQLAARPFLDALLPSERSALSRLAENCR